MTIFNQVAAKACYFYIRSAFKVENKTSYLVNEFNRVTDGHFMGSILHPEPNHKFYKFAIYPDPSGKKDDKGNVCYRLAVKAYEQHAVDFLDRLTLQFPAETDRQLFTLARTTPAIDDPNGEHEWYNIKGLERDQMLWIEPIGWVHPSSGSGDSVQVDHMKFRFEPCDVWEPDESKIKKLDQKEPARNPWPEDDVIIGSNEFGKKLVATEAIPATYISDSNYESKLAQLQLSPYYYLTRETVWVQGLIPPVYAPLGEPTEHTISITSAFKSEHFKSVRNTVGYTIDASLEGKIAQETKAGIGEGEEKGESKVTRSATLKLAVQYKNQTETINRDQTSNSTEIKETIKKTYTPVEDGYTVYFWVPVDRYRLEDSDGETIGQWDHADIGQAHEQRIYKKKHAMT